MAVCCMSPSLPTEVAFNSTYSRRLLVNLNKLRSSSHFCDVEITAGESRFKVHRAVLSASSAYFHAMFTAGLVEEQQQSIELKSLSSAILGLLLDFMYTGEVLVTEENVQELVIAADMLELTDVVSSCATFLEKQLDPSNCLGIYRFSEAHHLHGVSKVARAYIHANFPEVALQEEFLELPKDLLLEFLASEQLQIDNEFQVFSAAVRWITADVTQRRRFVFEILHCIRLPLIRGRLLEKYMNECCDISLKVALRSIRKDVQNHTGSLAPLCVQPRLRAKKTIYVIGGSKREMVSSWYRSENTLDSVQRFDCFRKEWKQVSNMEIGRILPGVAVLNGKIFVVGGEQESQILANGELYDPQEDTWKPMASMVIPRCEFGLCAVDGVLYAFGGWVGEDIGGTIEKYDPYLDEWRLGPDMPQPRFSMGVVAYQGLVYLVGGCAHSQRHLQDLVCYNPVTGEWTKLAPMLVPRSQMGVAVLDDYLFVVGGINRQNEVLSSVERYSFEEDMWQNLPPMKVCRASPAVAAADGLLYVMGGDQIHQINDFYRSQITISSVECFDPHISTWLDCVPLPESRSEAGAVVL